MKDVREHICDFGLSLYQRGLTHGSTGNLSARLPDGNPCGDANRQLPRRLTPESLSVISPDRNASIWSQTHKRSAAPSGFLQYTSGQGRCGCAPA